MTDARSARRRGSATAAALVLLLALLPGGCAVALEEHRGVLNWLDAELAPRPTAARVALVPVALPVGVLGYVVDSFVVNPVRVADDAWFDMLELLWESQADESTYRRVLMAPVALILSPAVLVIDWLGRFLLPIPSREDAEADAAPEDAP